MMDGSDAHEVAAQDCSRPRKIHVDNAAYCLHSMRESSGDAGCDHDFDDAPSVENDAFVIWNCTKCGRAFRFEAWQVEASVG